MNEALIGLGIALCLTQSPTFSGLNLALFSISRLQLESAAEAGDEAARRVLDLLGRLLRRIARPVAAGAEAPA